MASSAPEVIETVVKNKTMIPSFDKIIEVIKEQHPRFPHFGFIVRDFAVDNESRPVLVEINLEKFLIGTPSRSLPKTAWAISPKKC